MDLALDQVRSLLAVVDYGGYHRAADALHLSQPAISKHVRRVEEQVGGPLFERRGRGVEVSPRGEEVVAELRRVVEVHDEALARLTQRGADSFVLGAVEHLCDPMLPDVLATLRGQLELPIHLRVDRSRALCERVATGEVDAAIVLDPYDAADPQPLGDVSLHWWAAGDAPVGTDPLPIVAYDAPCGLRDLQLAHLDRAGVATTITAESPHLTGIHAAVRSGLGVALLAGGADGLRRVDDGVLGEPLSAPLWFVAAERHQALAEPLRAALWAAGTRASRRAG